MLGPGAFEPGGHDPRAGAGHGGPSQAGQAGRQVPGLRVERVGGQGAGRSEHGYLRDGAIGGEYLEALDYLPQGGVGDLEIEAVEPVGGQTDNGNEELP